MSEGRFSPMELAQLPLSGRVMVEASAGTGKTWTIAALYVRLLLELRLPVQSILVLTFTNAATAELRGRIYERLIEVRDALKDGTDREDDTLLMHVLRTSTDRARDVLWLNAAIESFDLAAIHTIHGFCQRALAEHAFESGLPFEIEIVADDKPLIEAVARDLWRRELGQAHPLWAEWLHARGMHPGRWAKRIASLLGHSTPRLYLPDAPLANLEERYSVVLEHARALWCASAAEAFALISESKALDGRKYSSRYLAGWWARIEAELMQPDLPAQLFDKLERFTPEGLRANVKKGSEPPQHALFDALAEWQKYHESFAARFAHWTKSAKEQVDVLLRAQKAQSGQQSYDDLLRNLEAALKAESGTVLAGMLRQRYAAALIDEFQDTDPRQYEIFEAIYVGSERPLYFVGDPKQAIYGFRGADVQAYLRAGRAAKTGFTLDINRRSTPRLVQALNALFECNPDAFLSEEIRYARARPELPSRHAEGAEAPLQCWFMAREEGNKEIDKAAAAERAIAATTDAIAQLLAQGTGGGDIAVLTSTHRRGQEMRAELAARGIASVTYGQDNVYQSAEAEELACVLAAVAEPAREDLLRAALATNLLGRDAAALEILQQDSTAWEKLLERYAAYQELARRHGFMRMWRGLCADEKVATRLLSLPQGERRLTNLQHLTDLLDAAAGEEALDLEALLRHLWHECANNSNKAENQQLRLESDCNLVRILTVHAAKGLQFPFVFCPFLWDAGRRKDPDQILRFHDEEGEQSFDLDSSEREAHEELAKREAFEESLRVAYVALTRAQQRCIFVWGAIRGAEKSPLAWLLHGVGLDSPVLLKDFFKRQDDAALRADMEKLEARTEGALALTDWPARADSPGSAVAPEALKARSFDAALPQVWRLSSFSGLIAAQEREASDYDALNVTGAPLVDAPVAEDNLFAMPGGVRTGTLIHQLFENIDFRSAQGTHIAKLVRRKSNEFDFDARWAPILEKMIADVTATPLNDAGDLRLDRIAPEQRIVEMEFLFPVGAAAPGALREALAPLRTQGSRLPEAIGTTVIAPIQGFIRGFIDLVFEADGRYYLTDYKSNHLGMRYEDYAPAALAEAMHASWYDLQYLLYSLALHRHLRLHLTDYDYERHFGGIYYLFVRGMSPESGNSRGVYFTRPPRAMIEALDAALFPTQRWAA